MKAELKNPCGEILLRPSERCVLQPPPEFVLKMWLEYKRTKNGHSFRRSCTTRQRQSPTTLYQGVRMLEDAS